jgi:CHAT domain-containing protein
MAQLKWAPLEGIVVGHLLTRCQHLEDAAATKQEFVREARERAYLHFAGHGLYDWDDPAKSGLCLSDGTLTLAEMERGRLDPAPAGGGGPGDPGPSGATDEAVDLSAARILTLSACEAGLVDAAQGRSGEYLSLPAGLMRAGVPCVLSSLWQVEDLSAILLLERFYRNHFKERMAPGLALHEAQSWMCTRLTQKMVLERIDRWQTLCRKAGRQDLIQHLEGEKARLSDEADGDPNAKPYSHPYHWAAFAVTVR